MRHATVFGAGGFIGSHMVKRLKLEGYWVRGVDQKTPEFSATEADEFLVGDLRDYSFVQKALKEDLPLDELYQFAADMGGAGFVFTGNNDAEIMHNSATINLNTLDIIQKNYPRGGVLKYFTQAVRACIPSTINWIHRIQIAKKAVHTLLIPTVNTGGKNCSPRGFTLRMPGIIIYR